MGYTCESYANFKKAKHCRFCDEEIKVEEKKNVPLALQDVCEEKDCKDKAAMSCEKIL